VLKDLADRSWDYAAVGATSRNGRIVVSVPNLGSLQARIGGRRWFHLDGHATPVHFTRRGLVRPIGLAVTRTGNVVLDQNVLRATQMLLNRLMCEQNVAFRMLKRDLAGVPPRDLVVSAARFVPAAVVRSLLDIAAMSASRGRALVVHPERPWA